MILFSIFEQTGYSIQKPYISYCPWFGEFLNPKGATDHTRFQPKSHFMDIKWTKAAHGFQQATYPNNKYRLSAHWIREIMVDGRVEERITHLGRVDVEERADGSLNFLFGSQIAFWPEVYKKLQEIKASPEEIAAIVASMATKIPLPPKDQTPPRIIRGIPVG
ncbi:MAG: hypothetical protein HQL89_17250 [Magnetococcales bacterium]|nr:hypothetical protein [Magnetococcales bacterium]